MWTFRLLCSINVLRDHKTSVKKARARFRVIERRGGYISPFHIRGFDSEV